MVALALAACSLCASAEPADPVADFVQQALDGADHLRADADLDGDGRAEAFVYVTERARCGSGGCNLYILSPRPEGLRVVLRSSVTRLPVTVLETSTRGWRDVGVTVSGGGIGKSHMARLQFDGERYPANPTVAPALPLARPAGQVLIER